MTKRSRYVARNLLRTGVASAVIGFGLGASVALSQGSSLSGKVVRVIGPNEVVVEGPGGVQYPVRLRGTATGPDGHPAASGVQDRLAESLLGRHVTVGDISNEATGLQGVVTYGDEDVNEEWVRDGRLRFDPETASPDSFAGYSTAETEARHAERGIWRPIEPRETAQPPAGDLDPPPGGWHFRPLGPSDNRK